MDHEPFYFSGVGAREHESEAAEVISEITRELAGIGGILRTAKAKGIDRLFRDSHPGASEIISDKAVPPDEAYEIAERNHGAWHLCDERTRAVHARNVMIHLGASVGTPVRFCLVWSSAGIEDMGGSALGMRVCREFGIPFFNVRDQEGLAAYRAYIDHALIAPRAP
ncbi:hypothetical protein G6L37_04350 [Agrobacterium rubi]|nr:hypothetical protein [Agrobacterium rubi]NTF24583.1 hypothetical protein [Agrobacterium rubi]